MDDQVKKRRELTAFSIGQNPVSITITRTEKVPADGGFNEQISTKGPFTVRLYQQTVSRSTQDISVPAGSKKVDKGWGMLADYLADVKAGTDIIDEFDAIGGHFKIVNVNPQIVNNQAVGYQCDLERVI